MGEAKKDELVLRVEELDKRSSGRIICRINDDSMKKLGLDVGDIVEIIGKRSCPAIAFPSTRDSSDIIRLDGLTRKNAGCSVGEYVRVRKAVVKDARYIKLSHTKRGIEIAGGTKQLISALQGKPLKAGMVIRIVRPNIARKKDDFQSPMQEIQKLMGGLFGPTSVMLGEVEFFVKDTYPSGIVMVTKNTRIEIAREVATAAGGDVVTYDDIGGLDDALQKVREMIELPLKHPELFQRVNIEAPKGVLLYGPPGTGKTLLARAVSHETNAHFITINGPEVMSKFYGESEQNLRKIFEEAERNAPSIIFIDEIDSIAPKREQVTGEVERRVVAQLLGMLDGLKGRGKVIVIGATNRIDSIDPALRRPGRFDREIELGVPDTEGRKEIFQIHTRGMPLDEDVDLDEYAKITHGFVGADIMAVCREAAMAALREILKEIDLDKPIPLEVLEKVKIKDAHFRKAIQMIEPSAMREVMIDIPNVKWEDIGGLEEEIQELREAIEWPIKYPEVFKKAGIRPVNGILLYGPPGCGKTLLAKAIASESGINFISVKGPELFDKFVGETEKAIRERFRKARQAAPSILYFDEFDSIANARGGYGDYGSRLGDQVVNQILVEMDGLEDRTGVVVVASTNKIEMIDPAMLRPGRFDRILFVDAPDEEGRLKILQVHTRNMPLTEEAREFLKEIAKRTKYYSGADLENLCREAGMQAIREKLEKFDVIEKRHFEYALNKIQPSLNEEILKHYYEQRDRLATMRSRRERSPSSLFT